MKHFFSAIEGAKELGVSKRHFWRIAPEPAMHLGRYRVSLWTRQQIFRMKYKAGKNGL